MGTLTGIVTALVFAAGIGSGEASTSVKRTADGGLLFKVAEGAGVLVQEDGKEPENIAELPEEVERVRKDLNEQTCDLTAAVEALGCAAASAGGAGGSTGGSASATPTPVITTVTFPNHCTIVNNKDRCPAGVPTDVVAYGHNMIPGVAKLYRCQLEFDGLMIMADAVVEDLQQPNGQAAVQSVSCTMAKAVHSSSATFAATFRVFQGARLEVPLLNPSWNPLVEFYNSDPVITTTELIVNTGDIYVDANSGWTLLMAGTLGEESDIGNFASGVEVGTVETATTDKYRIGMTGQQIKAAGMTKIRITTASGLEAILDGIDDPLGFNNPCTLGWVEAAVG